MSKADVRILNDCQHILTRWRREIESSLYTLFFLFCVRMKSDRYKRVMGGLSLTSDLCSVSTLFNNLRLTYAIRPHTNTTQNKMHRGTYERMPGFGYIFTISLFILKTQGDYRPVRVDVKFQIWG